MTRHTRNRQMVKLAIMQGYHVPLWKWDFQTGTNLPMESSVKLATEIDKSFSWYREEVVNYRKGRKTLSNTVSFCIQGGRLPYQYIGVKMIPVKAGEKCKERYNHLAEMKDMLKSMEEDLKSRNTYDEEDEVL